MANHISHASLPFPVKNARFTVLVPYLDADGDPTDPTTPDTEVSQDGGAFSDAAEEVTTISGSNGLGYVTLTGAEMNNSAVGVAFKIASGPKATLMTLFPRILPVLLTGTASAGAAGSITLAAGAYDLTGCIVRTTGGTGGGGTGGANNQARMITAYNTSTLVATISPNWETTPDATTTYDVLLTDLAVNTVITRALRPATDGRTVVVDASGLVDANTVKVGPTGSGSAQTARDIGASVLLSTGTGTGQLDFTSGVVKANATQWLGGTIPAVNVTGVPLIDLKYTLGTISPATAGSVRADAVTGAVGSVTGAVGSVTGAVGSVTARVTANTDQLAGQTVTAAAGVTFPTSVASPTNITAGAITTVGSVAAGGIAAASFAAGAIDAAAIATDAIDADALKADAITEIQAGLSTLNAAGVRGAVGLATANLDTQLDALPTAAENADAVWDEAIAGHAGAGSTGEALTDAATGGGTPPTVSEIADEVQTRTIAAVTLVNGLAANTVNAAALATDAVTEIVNATWATVIETGYSAEEVLRILAAVAAGKTLIAPLSPGALVTFRDLNDTVDRVVAEMTSDPAERADVTLTP